MSRELHGKRVRIRCDHGLGEVLQLIRYAPLLKEIAAEVIVCANPVLIPLLEKASGIDRLLPLHDGAAGVDYDVDVEWTDLAHVFRTIPRDVPCLHVDPLELPRDHRLRAGVAWRAADCSIPFALVRRLAAVSGVTFYALQCELEPSESNGPFVVLPEREDPLDAARLVRALDLVISIDSMPAQLAAALGVPVWTMRLDRHSDGWENVIAAVVRDLRAQTRQSHIRIDVDDHSTYLPLRHSG